MKRRVFLLFVLLTLAGCEKYDDSSVKSELSSLQSRVSALETLCSQMNSNINGLQAALSALQANVYVSGVSNVAGGYTISFTNGKSITIYDGKNGVNGKDGTNGKDGKDGSTPTIGVALYNGVYYWTLNGSWLTDNNGNKIPATGANGKDGTNGVNGITPQMKIENGYWYLSLDNGATWTQLGKATGEDGKDGKDGKDGDSMFKSVSQDDDNVYLILSDGTTISLPKEKEFAINVSKTTYFPSTAGLVVPFTVVGATEDVEVSTFTDGNIEAHVEMTGLSSGKVHVTLGSSSTNGKVLLIAVSESKSTMKILTFEAGVLTSSSSDKFSVSAKGGTINMSVTHNAPIEFKSNVSWITSVATKAVKTESFAFNVAENSSMESRSGVVEFKSVENGLTLSFTVIQSGKQITDMVAAQFGGGSIISVGNTIRNGSRLSWYLNNNSPYEITVKSLSVIQNSDGNVNVSGAINEKLAAGSSSGWNTTIGGFGVVNPIGVFCYEYNGKEYYAAASYDNSIDPYVLKSIAIDAESNYLIKGGTSHLSVKANPYYIVIDTEQISWTSSNPDIVSVTQDGTITANAVGKAAISMRTNAGDDISTVFTVIDPNSNDIPDNVLLYKTTDNTTAKLWGGSGFEPARTSDAYIDGWGIMVFPSTLKKVGTWTFYQSALQCAIIPSGVEWVGGAAFSRCSGLEYVKFLGESAPEFDLNWLFDWSTSDYVIYVPSKSEASYRNGLGSYATHVVGY